MAARNAGWTLVAGLAVSACLVTAGAVADSAPCPTAGSETVSGAEVSDRLELRLVDGRILRLAGLDPAAQTPGDPDLGETARQKLALLVGRHPLSVDRLEAKPDRWGRLAAYVFIADASPGEPAGGLAAAAIGAGLGRYLAEPAARACRQSFLAAEADARRARLGLWRDPYYAVLAIDDRAAFAERSATVVLAEGRLSAVDPGPYRTKLRFASGVGERPSWDSLAAVLLPRTMSKLEDRGVDLKSLIGRTLRLRGLLDLRFGPQIEIEGADQIEVLDGGPAALQTAR